MTLGVEHVDVEVDVDGAPSSAFCEPRRASRRGADDGRVARAARARPASRSRTPHSTTRVGIERRPSRARVPHAARAGQAHAAEEAADGVVSGVLKSPWASSQSTARVGAVARDGRQRRQRRSSSAPASSIGKRAGRQRVVDLAARLQQAAARVAQVVLPVRPRAARRASRRTAARRRAAGRSPRPAPARRAPPAVAVRRAAQQRDDAVSPSLPLRLPLLEERGRRPRRCPRSRTRSSAARAGTRARPRRPCPAGGTSRPCPCA